jgi:DNA polymerase III subunit beta
MRVYLARTPLLKALNHCQSVVEKKTTLPLLSHILVKAEGDKVTLAATDLDLYMRETLDAKVEEQGSVTLPAVMLYDIARKLSDDSEILIDSKAGSHQIFIRSGRSQFTLLGLKAEDFPEMPMDQFPSEFHFDSTLLQHMIKRSRFAMSQEEARYALNGVYMHVSAENTPALRCVATDGHRLARLESQAPMDAAQMTEGVILPKKTVDVLCRLLDDTAEPVLVKVSGALILFQFQTMELCSKLVDGQFPQYQKLIPTQNELVLECTRKHLVQAIDRATIVASEKMDPVKLRLFPDKMEISLQGGSSESAVEEIEAVFKGQDQFSIGFNPHYLLEILQQIDDEILEMRFKSSDYSVLIKGQNNSDALYVLMPMMVA